MRLVVCNPPWFRCQSVGCSPTDVHPVAILSAMFQIVWSLVIPVVLAIGDQIVDPYSRIGLVMAL